MNILAVVLITTYVLCLWGYHYLYFFLTERSGVTTQRNLINDAVLSWFEIALEEKEYLLVIHQIRNVIMAVTFLATTVVLLLGLIFGLSASGLPGNVNRLTHPLWLMAITLIYSFFNFLLCLRHFTRITFLIRSAPEKLQAITGDPAEVYLSNLFIRGNREYTLGRRSMLYGMVVLTWFLSPVVFLILTLVMTAVFIMSYDFRVR